MTELPKALQNWVGIIITSFFCEISSPSYFQSGQKYYKSTPSVHYFSPSIYSWIISCIYNMIVPKSTNQDWDPIVPGTKHTNSKRVFALKNLPSVSPIQQGLRHVTIPIDSMGLFTCLELGRCLLNQGPNRQGRQRM